MSACFSCVKPRVGAGDRGSRETFSPEHWFSTPFPPSWSTNGRSRWSACIRRSRVGAPSLLLRRSHLLPSLFALLSVAFSCRPINHTYTYTHTHTELTYTHIHTSINNSPLQTFKRLHAHARVRAGRSPRMVTVFALNAPNMLFQINSI